jgi:serine/threonine-protein kinase
MLVGKVIGPYTVEKEIGAGAMGAVYRARHQETGKPVAVKVIAAGHAANEIVKQRFEREFEILKQLKHPNIVRLIGTGRVGGVPFYAMEYVDGESLDKVMARRGRIDWEEVVRLGRQLCAGLQHAHDQGIVHRDLKPSNIMVLKDGTVKLTDFGIAKDLDRTAITEVNCTVGTASYMSPEQCRGERNLTHKSDLYSMGVMFYELLTGKKPFEAESPLDMFMQHIKGKFERPSRLSMDVPIFLDTLVCQLMEKDPDRRPLSAATVAEALERVAEKVAAQHAAGIDAAKTSNRDKPPDAAQLEDVDKDAARALLGKKKKKRRLQPIYQRVWFKALALSAALAGVMGLLFVLLFVKPSPQTLFQRAEAIMDSEDLDRQLEARKSGPIYDYLRFYGDSDDQQTRKMRKWADEVDSEDFERRLLKRLRNGINVGVDDLEQACRNAIEAEEAGNLAAAHDTWAKLAKHKEGQAKPERSDERACGLVAEGRLLTLEVVDKREKKLEKGVTKNDFAKGYTPADEQEKKAALAWQLELQKSSRASKAWQDFQKEFDRDTTGTRPWWLLAAKHLRGLVESEKKGND